MEEKADFQIEGAFNIMDNIVMSGTVKSGTIRPGMKADLEGNTIVIEGIESFRKVIQEAGPETQVGLKLSNANKEAIENRINSIITFSGEKMEQQEDQAPSIPPTQTTSTSKLKIAAIGIIILFAIGYAISIFL